MRCTNGLAPGTIATATTLMVPVDPAETSPVLSTLPSKRPPAPLKRIRALSTGLPAESVATATRRRVSPGANVAEAGVLVRVATGEGVAGEAGVAGCCTCTIINRAVRN